MTRESGTQSASEGGHSDVVCGQLVTCCLDQLRPHASYVRHRLTVPACQLSALAEQGDRAFLEPLVITQDRTILDGYARWDLARQKGRATLLCIEYALSDEEALRWLLEKHCRSNGLNDFCRVLLALELEGCFRERALSNLRRSGKDKGSSNLTKADRVDVRKKIAEAAHVSVGNVSKVKQLMGTAHPELLAALRSGEVSIHRAWKWSVNPRERQTEALTAHRAEKGVRKAIRELLSRHDPSSLPTAPLLETLVRQLSQLEADETGSVNLSVLRIPGKTIFVTEELLQSLPSHQESVVT